MNREELINLQKQIKEEYEAVKTEFEQFCEGPGCSQNFSREERAELYAALTDGEQYDELNADVQNLFWFADGKARRKFDVLRNKGGLLCRLYKMINEITKEETSEDEWFDHIENFEIERLVKESEKVVSDEQDFLKTAEKVSSILNELPKE